MEAEGRVVAVGRTAGDDGDVFALRSDLTLNGWTASTVAAGAGLQLVGATAAEPSRQIAIGQGVTWASTDGVMWQAQPRPELGDGVGRIADIAPSGDLLLASGPSRYDLSGSTTS